MMVNADLLDSIQAFQALDPAARRSIAAGAQQTDFAAGADLYQQGDPPTGFYMLLSGRVKLSCQSKEKNQILALPGPGECIGAESLPTGGPSPYSATTLKNTTALYLAPDALHSLLAEHPAFQVVFLRLITSRLRQFVALVHDLAFRDVTSRLAMVLVSRAEKEGQRGPGGISFERLLSQQEYAAMVGTAREVVYRTFRKFEEDGLIRTSRSQITILDLPALRTIALQELR